VTPTRKEQDYRLCSLCAQREGAGQSAIGLASECYICQGLTDGLERATREAIRCTRRYEFDTFSVGISLPDGVQEREDEFRANLKLMGKETIRAQAARIIAGGVASTLKRKVDRIRPDVSVVVDLARSEVAVSSRPLFFYGRYTKPPGVAQKREPCRECSGRGCQKCGMTGFGKGPSVEEQLRKRFAKTCGSDKIRVTWIGSEDRESRVYPPGRPFVLELKNPVKREVPKRFTTRVKGGVVSVSRGRMLPSRPTRLPPFRFRTLITAVTSKTVEEEALTELKRYFRRTQVRFERPHENPTTKTVYFVRGWKDGRTLTLEAMIDGGLPVKRFVSGELVSPSVSEVLKTEVRCRTFDIREVHETGELGFGKITRL
jgi:tRNA pseudouridine synthase 10